MASEPSFAELTRSGGVGRRYCCEQHGVDLRSEESPVSRVLATVPVEMVGIAGKVMLGAGLAGVCVSVWRLDPCLTGEVPTGCQGATSRVHMRRYFFIGVQGCVALRAEGMRLVSRMCVWSRLVAH